MRRGAAASAVLSEAPEPAGTEAAVARYRGTRVYIPWVGKTLFDFMGRFGLDIRCEMPPGDLDHGLIVISFPHSTKPPRLVEVFDQLRGVWTEELRQAAIERRVRIVLDASAEGYPPARPRLEAIHRGFQGLGVPVEAGVLLTQDRGYAATYARYLRKARAGSGLRVINEDFWIRRFHQQFLRRGAAAFARRLADFEARPKVRSRRFVSLNLTPRATKVLFLLSLIRDDLWSQGYVSCGGLMKKTGRFDTLAELAVTADYVLAKLGGGGTFEELAGQLLPFFPALQAKGQILLGEVELEGPFGRPKGTPINPMLREYDDSWFTAVTETEMRTWRSRITEKSFGPLVNFHPMVVFGNPGSLSAVRGFGYQTFGAVIDESYDDIEDPGRRFAAAYQQFTRLCRMDPDELVRMEDRLREALVFNAEWGLVRLPAIYRDRLGLAFLDRLFEARSSA